MGLGLQPGVFDLILVLIMPSLHVQSLGSRLIAEIGLQSNKYGNNNCHCHQFSYPIMDLSQNNHRIIIIPGQEISTNPLEWGRYNVQLYVQIWGQMVYFLLKAPNIQGCEDIPLVHLQQDFSRIGHCIKGHFISLTLYKHYNPGKLKEKIKKTYRIYSLIRRTRL